MRKFIVILIYSLLLFGCGGGSNTTRDYNYEFTGESSDVLDGEYCAEIEYYNPDTGTNSTYTLPIEVNDGYLTRIKWSNGGWLDNSHFTEPVFDGDTTSFTDDRGNDYTVTIINDGSCGYTSYITPEEDDRRAIEEQQRKEQEETCPICYGSKSSYEEICYFCERKQEREQQEIEDHTCSRCGGRKFSSFVDYCDDCERDLKEENEW